MSHLLIKMAQTAIEDKSLFAPYIQQYALQKSLSWEEVADELQIGSEQLARLALCSRPQPASYNGKFTQIAEYVGMEHDLLEAFVDEVGEREATLPNRISGQLKKIFQVRTNFRNWHVMAPLGKKLGWVVGAVALLILLLGAFVLNQPQGVPTATLVVNQGQATIVQANARNDGQSVLGPGDGALAVGTGDHISLTAASTAQLRLIDGSTIELAPGTEVNVDELVIDDATYRVHLRLLAGRTLSRVVSVLGLGDRFEISTPSSTASVRGTIFTVAYLSADETYISCDEGQVEVTLMGQEPAMVTAGMEVTAVVGQPLQVKSQQASEIQAPMPVLTTVSSPAAELQEEPASEPEKVSIPVEKLPVENGPDGAGWPIQKPPEDPQEPADPPEDPQEPIDPPEDPQDPIDPPEDPQDPPEDPPDGTPPNDVNEVLTVTICHQPGTPAEETLTIPESALQGHLEHGDWLGACSDGQPDSGGGDDSGNAGGNDSGNAGGGGSGNAGGNDSGNTGGGSSSNGGGGGSSNGGGGGSSNGGGGGNGNGNGNGG